ncbi:sensor histidine kinase [Maledivibacter halophilus]|uniref:histidine kinase n=1 Tax=Maledivibacter halophilus TaxID=36842 RepID=A0A1T5JY12_9FIRM|nr:HAMP domain-containing sensor histidine kinase [Maledivibacter halophilus]SKC56159.1 Signal transduction histidine kinase [Maledivibacter halophilus]
MLNKKYHVNLNIMMGYMLFVILTVITLMSKSYLFNIIVWIREAINSGDSGNLVLASASANIFFTVHNILLYISILLIIGQLKPLKSFSHGKNRLLFILVFLLIKGIYHRWLILPWEPLTDFLSLIFITFLMIISKEEMNLVSNIIVSIQVFFAVQWINIMPALSSLGVGAGDISVSIKIVGFYLESESILNTVGIAFLIPLLFSSIMTALLYSFHHRHIIVVEENYQKARELESMQAKVMENKIYHEINALAHDLKTPLVTIRGLNSLLLLSKDLDKLSTYSKRIESAVEKMSEMISSFLYGKSRQVIDISVLINYIRSQIPIEDESLKFEIQYEKDLPPIIVNKIRVSRAIINLIQNAIIAENTEPEKRILLKIEREEHEIVLKIIDNGIGIPPNELDDIWKIGHSTNNTSGLGLPFARQIIEENNGIIAIESQYGFGTTVIVKLPIANIEDRGQDNG